MNNDFEKKVSAGIKWFGALWLVSFILSSCAVVGIVYVVLHFLFKYW